MKIYNDSSIHDVLKSTASEKSISKFDLEHLRAGITHIYNLAISTNTLSKEQTTNVIYQIETGGRVKDCIPSMISKECINLMIDIHNKVDNKSSKIKDYTMILNHIEKNKHKENSKTLNAIHEKSIKEQLLNKTNDLENKIGTANLVLNHVVKQHKLHFKNLMSQLECLNTKESFEDKRKEFNHQQSELLKLIKFNKLEDLNKKDRSEIEKQLAKREEHNNKLDDIIKVLKDITSIYINLEKDTTINTLLTSENILETINNHIEKIKEINSKNI